MFFIKQGTFEWGLEVFKGGKGGEGEGWHQGGYHEISCFLMWITWITGKKMNQDLKNLLQWLKANKLSLNVKKTELIIFHPKNTKLDYSVKFKLNGKTLNPISTVKYLGILLDKHLLWTKQVNWVNSKLNQTIGILSKLRYNVSLPVFGLAVTLYLDHIYIMAPNFGDKEVL